MELLFGEYPSTGHAGSISSDFMDQEPQLISKELGKNEVQLTHTGNKGEAQMVDVPQLIPRKLDKNEVRLTHVGNKGEAQMVDVSSKKISERTAIASCKVMLGKKVFDLVSTNQMAKGDVLTVAKIAGINGAKQTSSLIPLCHNIGLSHIRVDLTPNPNDSSIEIEGEAASMEKTGVEMEAMTAVTVAGLTVYDMCKGVSKDIKITDVRLECKTGGKSGDWSRKE